MIIEACAKFWERVQTGNPPDPVTYADAVARFGKAAAKGAVVASRLDIEAVNELRAVRSEKTRLEAREEEIRGGLIISLGENGDVLIDSDGSPLITYKLSGGRKMLDSKSLEKEMPDVYQKYLKHGEPSRRFLLK